VIILVGWFGPQQIERVTSEIVIESGSGLREQQPRTIRQRTHNHEELVVDREHAEHRAGGTQPTQFGQRLVQVVQRRRGHGTAPPLAVLTHDSYTESRHRFLLRHEHTVYRTTGLRSLTVTNVPAPRRDPTYPGATRGRSCQDHSMAPSTDTDAPDAALAALLAEANTLQPKTIALRRQLHRQPEQGLVLPDTQEAILRALDRLPLEIHRGSSSSSVTAVLRGSKPGPAVLLRGDMDALPLHEETGD